LRVIFPVAVLEQVAALHLDLLPVRRRAGQQPLGAGAVACDEVAVVAVVDIRGCR
jgi:hypothetical protein